MRTLLVETTAPQLLELHESEGKPLAISGIASMVDTPNGNGRVYPGAVMSREVSKMKEDLGNSYRVGTVDHPDAGASVADMALKFTDVWMEDREVHFRAEIIPTQKGRDLEMILRAGIQVGISSRGFGSAKTETLGGRRVSVIQDDYELETFDAVVRPSVANARIYQYEAQVRQALERLEEAEAELATAIETTVSDADSVQATDEQSPVTNEDGMSQNDTYALIERAAEMERRIKAEARTAQRAAPVVEDEDVEDVAVVESEETIVVAEETVTETVAEPVEEAAAEVEAVEVVAEVAAVAEVDPTAVSAEPVAEAEVDAPRVDEDRIIALTRRAEQAELATARLELELTEARATAERLLEDSNIQLAILAVSSAIAAEVAEGDWDSVSSLAGVASMLDYINHRDDVAEGEHDATDCAYCGAYDHLTTPRAKAAFEKAMAPVLTLAARVERDKVAIAKTEGERYGRRMLVLLREGCKTAGDVEAQVADVRARALSEATGRRVISETRGLLTTEQRTELTPEQREHRRLSGYRD